MKILLNLIIILNHKVNITATLAVAENFLGDDAYRPSDIITSRKGKKHLFLKKRINVVFLYKFNFNCN